jgi:malate dehydrogenase
MAVCSDGSYGVEEGLISSFPVTCSNGDWEIVTDLKIDDFSKMKIDASVQELSEERDTVSDLKLI